MADAATNTNCARCARQQRGRQLLLPGWRGRIPQRASYHTTKHAVLGLTQKRRAGTRATRDPINAVCPERSKPQWSPT